MITPGAPPVPPSAQPAEQPSATLSGRARAVRLAAAGLCMALLVVGTFWGDDDAFPFGPFRMYSTSTPPNGNIHVMVLKARMPDGSWREVPLDSVVVGVNRAEVEGQVPRFQAEPALVGRLVEAHDRLRPAEPRWTGARLVMRYLKLRDRRFVGTEEKVVAEWLR
ncbi:hypothetical protein [Microtetraspora sp. NBRC 16547]|uniref:hypothetical protein n=1 Tax=Microtetraspora sp. NBRC 16547 TaxID=3030993 RepID=UPI0025541B19|nr:hypothetical protein [Microtetraspora sp. NBRC 16547]